MKTEKQVTMSLDLTKQMLGKDEAMNMLIKQNFSDEELGIRPNLPKKWDDINKISGYFINVNSLIMFAGKALSTDSSSNKNILLPKNSLKQCWQCASCCT